MGRRPGLGKNQRLKAKEAAWIDNANLVGVDKPKGGGRYRLA